MTETQPVQVAPGRIALKPFTRAALPLVAAWFDDPMTRRYLGGPAWPAQMLAVAENSVGQQFRGQRLLASYRWLAWLDGAAVGYIDCGVTDRWTYCALGAAGVEVVASRPGPAGALALVVDPTRRNCGIGRATVQAMCEQPALAPLRLLEAGVAPDNTAIRRCLEAAGFQLEAATPDWEGMLYYLRAMERVVPTEPEHEERSGR